MRLRLLGPLELLDDAGIVVPIATPKRRGVLIALALELNRAVSVDRLLTSVWGSEPPRQARSALHGHIAQLRKALDGNLRLVTQAPGYMLAGAEELVDVAHFQKLLDRAAKVGAEEAVPLLSAALALWRGPTLAGLAGDEFLQHAAALQEARLGALERLASALTEFGRAQSTIPALAQAVARHPLRESLVRVLMLALYQEGRQAEALAAYQRARERLANSPRWTSSSSSRWRVLAGRGEFIGLHGESRRRRQGYWGGTATSSESSEGIKPLRGLSSIASGPAQG